jgi:hypothetical protein
VVFEVLERNFLLVHDSVVINDGEAFSCSCVTLGRANDKFEVFTVVIVFVVFWVVTPCSFVSEWRCFGGAFFVHLQD